MGTRRINQKRSWSDEQLIEAVKTSDNYNAVCVKLNLSNYGGNSYTIKKHIARLALDTSHFLTRSEILTKARKNSVAKKALTFDAFSIDSNVDRKAIKNKIIKDDLITYECDRCGLSQWQGRQLSLHLDHINGINNDNRLENLRFLCPNCHSLTETYCGRQLRGKRYANDNKCIDCGIPIYFDSTRCRKCSSKEKNKSRISWPSTQDLIAMVEEFGYRGTGKKLGVTDNSVKKRIINYPVLI